MILSKKKTYLQISLNGSLEDARRVIRTLPPHERIILEAGTPFIKRYGQTGIQQLRSWWRSRLPATMHPYILADMKTIDRAETEVSMVREAGASGITCMGSAPIETIDSLIEQCEKQGIDSMIDMMNVTQPVKTLRLLKKQPAVVMLHRGVDEEQFNSMKMIPYVQINKVLSLYDVSIAIAGGDTPREVQRAVFNGASIVVVWKEFYYNVENAKTLAETFLKNIKA